MVQLGDIHGLFNAVTYIDVIFSCWVLAM